MQELIAFTDECEATDATLAGVVAQDWQRAGLGAWSIRELVAHMVRGASRLGSGAAAAAHHDAEVVCDRHSYWAFDAAADAPGIAQRASDMANAVDADTLPRAFALGWRRSVEVATAKAPASLVSTARGPMRIDEYLATRVLEIVVHHMDLRTALDLPPVPTPTGGKLTLDLLEHILGGPRPRNSGRSRFIKLATGRMASDDPRFPLLS